MVRLRPGFLGFFFLVSIACAGCGGAGGSPANVRISPPPSPDFAITLSSGSLSISQGATGAPITVSVAGQNGFTGSVQITLAGMPAGVLSNPASPFSIASGASMAVVFGASQNATP